MGEIDFYARFADGYTLLRANEAPSKRMQGENATYEFETFLGAAGVAMDGNAGFELASERLIPVEPCDFRWQGHSPDVPIVLQSKFIEHSEIRSQR